MSQIIHCLKRYVAREVLSRIYDCLDGPVCSLTSVRASSKVSGNLRQVIPSANLGPPVEDLYRPEYDHRNLMSQVNTPLPPGDALFLGEATDREESHWHPTIGLISRHLKTTIVSSMCWTPSTIRKA